MKKDSGETQADKCDCAQYPEPEWTPAPLRRVESPSHDELLKIGGDARVLSDQKKILDDVAPEWHAILARGQALAHALRERATEQGLEGNWARHGHLEGKADEL